MIQSLGPELSINLNDERVFLEFKTNPHALQERIDAKKPSTVFIDEIQRHPGLLNTIQVLLDTAKNRMKFFITGSSARKLKRGRANLLPGRIFSFELSGLCAAELGYQLDVPRGLRYGFLPEPYLSTNDADTEKLLSTYAGVYLKEEIQAEALTRNLEGFSRFIGSAAKYAGQALDFSKLAKQAKIERKLCTRFYEVLEDTLVANRIEVYDATKADIVKRPKFYFFDVGVLNGLLGNFVASADRAGILFEHLVANQILNSAKARDRAVQLSYFRTRSGFEVDFILEVGGKTYAIEVKHGGVVADDAGRLRQFAGYRKKTDGFFIVSPQKSGEPRRIRDVLVCSIDEMLAEVGL